MTTKKTTASKAAKEDAATATAAQTDASATVTDSVADAPSNSAADALTQAANIPAATEVDTSGSPQQVVPDVDMSHPAVDDDPRKGTTVAQNRIDFNDPTISGQEAVERNLGMAKD